MPADLINAVFDHASAATPVRPEFARELEALLRAGTADEPARLVALDERPRSRPRASRLVAVAASLVLVIGASVVAWQLRARTPGSVAASTSTSASPMRDAVTIDMAQVPTTLANQTLPVEAYLVDNHLVALSWRTADCNDYLARVRLVPTAEDWTLELTPGRAGTALMDCVAEDFGHRVAFEVPDGVEGRIVARRAGREVPLVSLKSRDRIEMVRGPVGKPVVVWADSDQTSDGCGGTVDLVVTDEVLIPVVTSIDPAGCGLPGLADLSWLAASGAPLLGGGPREAQYGPSTIRLPIGGAIGRPRLVAPDEAYLIDGRYLALRWRSGCNEPASTIDINPVSAQLWVGTIPGECDGVETEWSTIVDLPAGLTSVPEMIADIVPIKRVSTLAGVVLSDGLPTSVRNGGFLSPACAEPSVVYQDIDIDGVSWAAVRLAPRAAGCTSPLPARVVPLPGQSGR